MCGNYATTSSLIKSRRGSPPRVRELRRTHLEKIENTRITPACAGITTSAGSGIAFFWDHPRVCGNYLNHSAQGWSTLGSPPRVRELHLIGNKQSAVSGITPACAGITHGGTYAHEGRRDHPRVCGNYLRGAVADSDKSGSPPRVRELLDEDGWYGAQCGITPACAGITPFHPCPYLAT